MRIPRQGFKGEKQAKQRERESGRARGQCSSWNFVLEFQFSPRRHKRRTRTFEAPPTNNDHNSHSTFVYRACIQYVLRYYKYCRVLFDVCTGKWLADPGARALRLQSAPGPPRVVWGRFYLYKFMDFVTVKIYKEGSMRK